jgi:4-hydroxy-3-methylbut-2-enyl diphosphate reductase
MRVICADIFGFCMGVRRAVEIAWRASENGLKTYTLGPLIHNSRVLNTLEERGVFSLKEDEIPSIQKNAAVIIRAHGVSPIVEKSLRDCGLKALDATCPNVKASQNKAKFFAEKGYRVFLAGEENHAEISGIRAYVQNDYCIVVDSATIAAAAAVELYRKEPSAKTVLIGQTTISPGEYRIIGEEILRYFPNLEIINTICSATLERQEALRKLCKQVDAVIIAGGRGSANTQRLLSLALELRKPAWLVESPKDIPSEIKSYETVGLSAGASTPDGLIDEIKKKLEEL